MMRRAQHDGGDGLAGAGDAEVGLAWRGWPMGQAGRLRSQLPALRLAGRQTPRRGLFRG
jgi:hypothetical protein